MGGAIDFFQFGVFGKDDAVANPSAGVAAKPGSVGGYRKKGRQRVAHDGPI